MQYIGKYILITGLILVIVGALFWLFGNKLTWLGNLPGDIKITRSHFTFYFPVTTMILISVLLSGIIWIINQLK